MGINTWVVSWVPHYCIRGMVVRHGEAFTISDRLTVWEDGRAVYRPDGPLRLLPLRLRRSPRSKSCAAATTSLQPKLRIMSDEITGGADILGALLMGHAYNSWWTGSVLSIEESRRLVPHQNATTMQVAISVVAAAMWMIENPDRGVCVPDDLPHDYVLEIARPYLGKSLSIPSDWTPLKNYVNNFHGYQPARRSISDDPWQFKNFLVTDGD